ncbi:MAG: ABC transporter ATP-binding protein [Clostridia bacterium]|nr:ABC transporter ATP-binding protein [Clostridia bacterium]
MPEPILKCTDLCKTYGRNAPPVLDHLNIELYPGRITGLLGPNGCGKSTLIKLIAGILTPQSGSIEICGSPRTEASCAQVAYLPERTYFGGAMTVDTAIRYFCDFYADFDEKSAREILSSLSIPTDKSMRHLSKGTQEKVQLALVMSRKASLYLLDEPIAGVDPAARDFVLDTILSQYRPDACVLISTHLLQDIESRLNDFFFLAPGGRIVLSGNAKEVAEAQQKSLNDIFREVFRC